METLLNVEGINVYYGAIHAIKDISFHVNEGEIVTLIGANGAGKTTTLQTISGLLRSKTGSITFEGQNISNVRADKLVARGLAQVPEGRRVFLQMSVEENLEMGAYTQSPSGVPADLEMVFELFPRLKERRRQVAGTLSGGEQQMLAMGRALMSHPKLLMLDEPSMGLAPILVEQIFEIIQNLNKNGSTILLVEQNAQMALSVAHRGYVLETGRVVTTGTGEELIESPEIKKPTWAGNLLSLKKKVGKEIFCEAALRLCLVWTAHLTPALFLYKQNRGGPIGPPLFRFIVFQDTAGRPVSGPYEKRNRSQIRRRGGTLGRPISMDWPTRDSPAQTRKVSLKPVGEGTTPLIKGRCRTQRDRGDRDLPLPQSLPPSRGKVPSEARRMRVGSGMAELPRRAGQCPAPTKKETLPDSP